MTPLYDQQKMLALGSFAMSLSCAYGHLHNLLGTTTPDRYSACLARLNASRDRAGHFAASLKTDGSPFAPVCEAALAAFDADLAAAAR